jgi:hypothetical protein
LKFPAASIAANRQRDDWSKDLQNAAEANTPARVEA